MPETYQSIAKRKQEDRDASIPKEWRIKNIPSSDVLNVCDVPRKCGILSDHEIRITEDYDATGLAEAIRNKKLKCIDVTRAFCKRAAIAQQLTNCLTEIFFDRAFQRAEYLDHYIERYGETLGPLHGVPISLKDTFRIPGYDSSIGLAALTYKPSTFNSPLVLMLQSAGAVFYCKTNVPQTMMSLDSENNVFGRTLNPLNNKVTAGGSSGGEGALVGIRGSVLGVGTDIGGSIRIPAMCNGKYGFKPSALRLPYVGQEMGSVPGFGALGLQASAGPIAHSVRDIELFMKTCAAAKPWEKDPSLVPGFWENQDQSIGNKPMTIGIMYTDGLIQPLPPIQKLLNEVARALSNAGVNVVTIVAPPMFKDAQSLANAMFSLEGGNKMFDLIESYNEPMSTWLAPRMKRKKAKNMYQAADLHAQRQDMLTEMLKMWKVPMSHHEVDAIICPVAPHPVPAIDSFQGVSYTSSWVLFDYPAATLPVRSFTKDDLNDEIKDEPSLGRWDDLNRELWDKSKTDRNVYLGTPLCVQVVAPKLQEKRLFRAMDVIDKAVHGEKASVGISKL